MTKLTATELIFFNAETGAKSKVTEREATGDKSVTIDRFEKQVLFSRYPLDIFTRAGGAVPDGKPSMHIYNIYDVDTHTYEPHEVATKLPKSKGNELRLYFNRTSGFYPDSDHDWFIFTREGEPHPFIGVYPSTRLENLASGEKRKLAFEKDYALDSEDQEYLMAVASPQAQQGVETYEVTSHKRNATLAANCIKKANYRCQINDEHTSFISRASGKQYVEAHHLIPISNTSQFDYSLDVEANIVVLCPNCHRAIHLAEDEHKRRLLDTLLASRNDALEESGINISTPDLYKIYNIEF